MKSARRAVLFAASLALLPLVARSQVQTGTPTFGSFTGGPEIINNANLNMYLSIPIITKAGRGIPFSYHFAYNSAIWQPVTSGGVHVWNTNGNFNWGWGLWDSSIITNLSYRIVYESPCYDETKYPPKKTGDYYELGGWVYYDATGAPHTSFGGVLVIWADGTCPSGPAQILTRSGALDDGSGDVLSVSGSNVAWTVTQSNGTVESNPENGTGVETVTDRNGNQITVSPGTGGTEVFTDTLGQQVFTAPANPPPNPAVYTYTGPQGSVSYTVKYTPQTVRTNFGCSGISEFGPTSESLVSEIDLPDGSKYTFSYEPTPNYAGDVTGRVKEITLPTGGSITYAYSGGTGSNNSGIICSDGTTATLTRTVTPGGSEPAGTWTYTHAESGNAWTTTATDPANNQSILNFENGFQTEQDAYRGSSQSGTKLETVYTCYNGASPPPCTGSVTLPITQRTVYTELPLGSGTMESEQNFLFNSSNGSPTEEDDYGYGSGAVGTLLRKTLTQYASLGNNITSLPSSVAIENGSGTILSETTYSYDQTSVIATSGTPQQVKVSGSRGNATTVSSLVSGSTFLTKSYSYFDTGNINVATDVNGAPTSNTFNACGNSFPTQIASPLSLNESLSWNCSGGVATSMTDANDQTTTSTYNDPYYWRPAQVSYADGGWQAFSYPSVTETDAYSGITNPTPSTSCTSGCRHDQTLLDGIGRTMESVLVSDPDGQTTVMTTYDPLNAQVDVTNPDRTGAPTNGTSTTTYDALGRAVSVKRPDGSIAYSYYGSDVSSNGGIASQLCSTSTYGYGFPALSIDAAGTKRESWTDTLGRTIETDEPDSSKNLTRATCYVHDANGNLTQSVGATGQARTYAYDGLGRITSATVPETNGVPTTYVYDAADSSCSSYNSNGDLVEQKNPSGKITCDQYDQLHRLSSISYSDGTHVINYYYDQTSYNGLSVSNGKGRRTGMADGSGETAFSYDNMGRVKAEEKTIAAVTKTISYGYNYDGSVASITYPDGRSVNYTYSNAQRPLSAVDSSGPINYANDATYWPQGALNTAIHGQVSGGFGGVTETWNYNDDLEATSINASSSTGTALNLTYNYALPGGNNGAVAGITNGKDANRNESMTYDPLLRLLSAQTAGTSGQDCWGLSFGSGGLADDTVGNLTSMAVAKCTGPSLSLSVNGNNQITNTGFSYDADGDATADGQYTYSYNAENQIIGANGVNYTYDGNGLRVQKSSGTLYWRSGTGQVLEETDTSGNMRRDYIFFAGRRIAWRDSSGNVYYYFVDVLGSTKTVTNATGNTCFDADYYPYGQENDYNTSCSPTYKFTGYEYDSETGNYYAYARYYNPRIGRFMTTDPLAGTTSNPQSLNRYSYVLNNPESMTDSTGMMGNGMGGGPPLASCIPWGIQHSTYLSFDGGVTWTFIDSWIDWDGFVCPGFPTPGQWYPSSGGGSMGDGCVTGNCGVPSPAPPPGEDLCIAGALEEVIAAGETSGQPGDGYGTNVMGTVAKAPSQFAGCVNQTNVHLCLGQLSSLTGNPGLAVQIGTYPDGSPKYSTAFGRYQITGTTARGLGCTDWTPSGQDDCATALLNSLAGNPIQLAMVGSFAQAIQAMSGTWSSLPGGVQARLTLGDSQQIFNDALQYLPECQ